MCNWGHNPTERVITPFITGRGPPCKSWESQGPPSKLRILNPQDVRIIFFIGVEDGGNHPRCIRIILFLFVRPRDHQVEVGSLLVSPTFLLMFGSNCSMIVLQYYSSLNNYISFFSPPSQMLPEFEYLCFRVKFENCLLCWPFMYASCVVIVFRLSFLRSHPHTPGRYP